MKNPVAFFLAILAVALSMIALYSGHADASTVVRHQGDGDSVAVVTVDDDRYGGTHHFECSGSTVEGIVSVCRETLVSLCPHGGRLSQLAESPEGVLPAKIEFDVVCTEDGTA